ncbi:transposase, partial [Mariprofundus sp. EBB-1]|uniref:transposase n=1 Tax=Mariprofundus sp. EBB-1 TaxID=2650971 RepID=UPI001912B5E1
FLLLLQEGIVRYGHRVHAFCLMTNHIHLLIQVDQSPLSRIIQNLSFRYTRYINRKKQETGHLFQGRYKAILVDEDSEPSTSTIEGVAQAEVSEEKKLVEPQSEELKSHKDLTHIDLRKTKVNSESIVSEPDMSLSNIVRGGVAILLSLIAIIYGAVGAGQGVSEVAFFGFGLFVFSISLFFYKKGWWIRVTGAIGLAVAMMAVLI